MQIDPMAEWQRITTVYRSMYDDELINLVADKDDLTEIARQVLDLELKRRGLGDLSKAGPARPTPEPRRERRAVLLGNQGGAPQLVIDYRATQDTEGGPPEYTWKTLLCECETMEQARQLSEALELAGIDSWIEDPSTSALRRGIELLHPRVMVAADQVEQARTVAANPIPQQVVDNSKFVTPEFEMPQCPHCGAKDPSLEGVDPFNSWRCESCGNQWTESGEGQGSAPPNGGK
jgi:hypothetical protein